MYGLYGAKGRITFTGYRKTIFGHEKRYQCTFCWPDEGVWTTVATSLQEATARLNRRVKEETDTWCESRSCEQTVVTGFSRKRGFAWLRGFAKADEKSLEKYADSGKNTLEKYAEWDEDAPEKYTISRRFERITDINIHIERIWKMRDFHECTIEECLRYLKPAQMLEELTSRVPEAGAISHKEE